MCAQFIHRVLKLFFLMKLIYFDFSVALGQFLSEYARHNEAAELFLEAAGLAPEEYEIVFNTANTLREAGRHDEAEQYYQQAARLRPQVILSFCSYSILWDYKSCFNNNNNRGEMV